MFSRLLEVVRTGQAGYPMLYGRQLCQDTMDGPAIAVRRGRVPALVVLHDWNDTGTRRILLLNGHGQRALEVPLTWDRIGADRLADEAAGRSRPISICCGSRCPRHQGNR